MSTVRKLGPTEAELHLSAANALDWLLLPPAFYTTFPAGWGILSGPMSQRLKKSGLKAGMPDILVFYDSRCYGLELKAKYNNLTRDQITTGELLRAAGVAVFVCRSVDDVITTLLGLDIPIRKVRGDDRWLQKRKSVPLDAISAKGAEVVDAGDDKHGRETA